MSNLADSLSPAELDMIHKAFGFEFDDYSGEFLTEDQLQKELGMVDQWHLWHSLWLFGVVLDDDRDYYVDPTAEGWSMNIDRQLGWYIPDDYDTEVNIVDVV